MIKIVHKIGDFAESFGVKIGIENDGGTISSYLKLFEKIKHPCIGATLSVGHCAFFKEVLLIENLSEQIEILNRVIINLIQTLRRRIFLLHVHNVEFISWRDHRSLPNGVVNFLALINALMNIGYEGFFIIELEERECEEKAFESRGYLTVLLNGSN